MSAIMRFIAAMFAVLLPYRHWPRLPVGLPVESAAFASGLATALAGAAIGIPGFIEHAHATTSLGLDAMLHKVFTDPNAGYNQGLVQGFAGLSIFTFLLLTPKGVLTLYAVVSGTLRMGGAWFDDPIGDPILTGVDALALRTIGAAREKRERRTREALEGPEIADRVVTSAAAAISDCDLVVVSSRRKPGWDRGVVVLTTDDCYRIGMPVERTVHGRLRTLYPLTLHRDFEAIRKSVRYDLPRIAKADDVLAAGGEPRPDSA
jgi:hypothetical protein